MRMADIMMAVGPQFRAVRHDRQAERTRERQATVTPLPRQGAAAHTAPTGTGPKVVHINSARGAPQPGIGTLPSHLQDMLPRDPAEAPVEGAPQPGILSPEQRDELKRQMLNG